MHWFRRFMWRLDVLFRKDALEAELDRELQNHLDAEIQANIRAGMEPGTARRKAMMDFGGVERVKEEVRNARGARTLDDFLQDTRLALRGLLKRPLFAGAAILTLGLGIGASTAMFTVMNSILLRPLPYDHPEELVIVWQELRARNVMHWTASAPELADYGELDSYRDVAGFTPMSMTLTGGDRPEEIRAAVVTYNFFRVLSGEFVLGRPFMEEDVDRLMGPREPGAEPPAMAVVMGHGLWQRYYGGDPGLVGRSIPVGARSMTVVGILAEDYEVLLPSAAGASQDIDLFVASPMPSTSPRRNVGIRVLARLKPGVLPAQAQLEMDAHWARMREEHQLYADTDHRGHVIPLQDDLVREVRPMILVLFGAVVLVLLIACANVSNLLLVRATARSREMSVRAALGGSRSRLVRQMLSEGLVLAGVGLVLGLLLAHASISILSATRPVELPRMDAINLDGVGFAFSFLTALGAVCLFAIVPAIRGTRGNLAGALQGRSAGTGNRGRTSFRNGLVVLEVALSLVLLIGAGLMVRSTLALARVDPGFDPTNVLTFVAAPPPTSFTSRQDRVDFLRELQARISALPGVTQVSAAAAVPFTTSRGGMGRAGPEAAFSDESLNQQARYTYLFPDYFETMGVRLLEGRLFAPEEYVDSIPVVVVDALLAQALWPGESAVGKTLVARPGAGEPFPFEVIGVVEHQMAESLREPGEDMLFYPVGFYTSWVNPSSVTWVVRAAVPPESLVPLIRREVEAVKADAPMTRIRTLESYLAESRAPTRFALTLTAFFAVSALVLSVVGLYGVLAYGVQQRTAEIGVRVAFGAEPGGILSMILGRGMRLVLVGLAGGVVSALALTPFMRSLLVGVPPTDLPTFLGVGALFSGVAALACLLPAWRATKVDPVKAIQVD